MTDTAEPDLIPPRSDLPVPAVPELSEPPRRRRSYGWLATLVLVILLLTVLALGALLVRAAHREDAALPAGQPSAASIQDDGASKEALAALDQRLSALETKVQNLVSHPAADMSGLASVADLQALTQRVQTLEGVQPQTATVAAQLQAVQQSLAVVQKQAQTLAARDKAWHDLEALRQSFPAAARAALAAAERAERTRPFWKRVLARVEALVVVRRGDTIILGDKAAGPLQAAQADLDRRDLAGALHEIDRLQGPAAIAMQGWAAQARAVLAEIQPVTQSGP